MANFICPVTPPTIWFPLDPNVVELPEAPPITVNTAPEPANTAPGTYTPDDFATDLVDYGYIRGDACITYDWGLITDTVTATADYKGVKTIWDLLPTDTPPTYAQETDTTVIYPPYREVTTQSFTALAVIEVSRINKITLELLPFICVAKTTYSIYRINNIYDIVPVTKTKCFVEQIGGDLPLVVQTAVVITSQPAALAVGMEYGYI